MVLNLIGDADDLKGKLMKEKSFLSNYIEQNFISKNNSGWSKALKYENARSVFKKGDLISGLALILNEKKLTFTLPEIEFSYVKFDLRKIKKQYDISDLGKQKGNLLERLMYCLDEHPEGKKIFQFLQERYKNRDNILPEIPDGYSQHPENLKPQIFTFMLCLQHLKTNFQLKLSKYLIYQILNTNKEYNTAKMIIEETLQQFPLPNSEEKTKQYN